MSTEGNVAIVSKYKDWKVLSRETVKGNIRTVDNESHRRPDPWHFLVGKNGLFDVPRQRYVHSVVKEYPHPNLYLREVEDKIIKDLDDWSNFGDEGYAIWASPLFPGYYDANKLEIILKGYTFGDMKRGTQNAVIVFDGNQADFMNVVKQIFPELEHITDPEEIRAQVIFRHELDIDKILEIIKPYLPKEPALAPVSEATLNYIVDLVHQGTNQYYIAQEMQRLGVIGKHSFGCEKDTQGGSTTQDMGKRGLSSQTIEGTYCKNCGYCGAVIEAFITKGYKCKACENVYDAVC